MWSAVHINWASQSSSATSGLQRASNSRPGYQLSCMHDERDSVDSAPIKAHRHAVELASLQGGSKRLTRAYLARCTCRMLCAMQMHTGTIASRTPYASLELLEGTVQSSLYCWGYCEPWRRACTDGPASGQAWSHIAQVHNHTRCTRNFVTVTHR